MARTTDEQVAGIIEWDSTIDLAPFIEIATDLVDEVCGGSGYSDTRLELIERWLAAHFYAVRDNRIASEGAGTVQASYQQQVGLNLNVTIYGQQVLMIDTKGGFAALQRRASVGGRLRAGVSWLGQSAAEIAAEGVEGVGE